MESSEGSKGREGLVGGLRRLGREVSSGIRLQINPRPERVPLEQIDEESVARVVSLEEFPDSRLRKLPQIKVVTPCDVVRLLGFTDRNPFSALDPMKFRRKFDEQRAKVVVALEGLVDRGVLERRIKVKPDVYGEKYTYGVVEGTGDQLREIAKTARVSSK